MTETSTKSRSTLTEMAQKGTEYRQDEEIEIYGETVEIVVKPLDDDKFLPLMAEMAEALDVDQESLAEGPKDEIEEEFGDEIEVSQMNEDFIDVMQKAAVAGLHGQYVGDDEVEVLDTERKAEVVSSLKGGASMELGLLVMDVSGNMEDAEKFP